MGSKKGMEESRLSRYVKAPIRFLCKARDLYVRGMIQCNGQFANMDGGIGCPAPAGRATAIPRSFSVSSTASSSASDDYGGLVRAASARPYRNGVVLDLLPQKQSPAPAKRSKMVPPRSRTVGMGRIDEDDSCEFEDEVKAMPRIYDKSRSHDVRRSTRLF